jgi:pullulanase
MFSNHASVLNRRTAFLLAIVLAFASLLGASLPSHAATDRQVTVHYFRFNADYTSWKLWLWPKGGSGADYNFSADDSFGKVGNFSVPASAGLDVGLIVKKGNWDSKDVASDRYITNWDASGNAEIWLVQGDATIYYSAPKLGFKIRSADAAGFDTVNVSLSKALTPLPGDNGFTLSGSGNPPAVASVVAVGGSSGSSTSLQLKLSGNLQFGTNYTLSHPDYGQFPINMSNLFDSKSFSDKYTYTGDDLGNTYTPTQTKFRVWAPTATKVELLTFATASTRDADGVVHPMSSDVNGTWVSALDGDQNGTIYAYRVYVNGKVNVANDPYERASTANGGRGVVVDLNQSNPVGFADQPRPAFSGKTTDASIYELHVRDLPEDSSSGISAANKGKYLAFTELNTHATDGKTLTGVSAIKELGVTHVELLPVFDFASVDEWNPSFNWGYDPDNYNVPEGSYSSNPDDPYSRITELKQAIQSLHNQGLRVNMDVVFNHVSNPASFSEELIVPGYFFRHEADGSFANGTGVGNEVASERSMVRKFIVDSVSYWAKQYHFDGFRFDLMGILDVGTMNAVRAALTAIDPTIIILGEGWNMGDVLPDSQKADQPNLPQMPGVAAFNDGIRDGLKGSVFNPGDKGWATGKTGVSDSVKAGIVGETQYSALVTGGWGNVQPGQSVNYVECHDNLTLYDKLLASTKLSATDRTKVFQLTSSVPILAQGMPFIQAGQEFLRSKQGNDNSYQASDAINSLKWNQRTKNMSTVNYFAGLFALRAAHPAFRMDSASAIRANLKFVNQPRGVISYSLNGAAVGDSASTIFVAHNPNKVSVKLNLPSSSNWQILVKGDKAGTSSLGVVKGKSVSIAAYSTLVLTK